MQSLKALPHFYVDWLQKHWARKIQNLLRCLTVSLEHRSSLPVKKFRVWCGWGSTTSCGWRLYWFSFSILKPSITRAVILIPSWAPVLSGDAQVTLTLNTLSFTGSELAVALCFQCRLSNIRSFVICCSAKRLRKNKSWQFLDWLFVVAQTSSQALLFL